METLLVIVGIILLGILLMRVGLYLADKGGWGECGCIVSVVGVIVVIGVILIYLSSGDAGQLIH